MVGDGWALILIQWPKNKAVGCSHEENVPWADRRPSDNCEVGNWTARRGTQESAS